LQALGLTRYSNEDMTIFVNQLADYIDFHCEDDGLARETSSRSFGRRVRWPEACEAEASWTWPAQDFSASPTSGGGVSMTVSIPTSAAGSDKQTRNVLGLVPIEALMEVCLSDDSDIHRRKIFDARCFKIYKAMKEILLAGDTNRLVAELTFVRINDLAAPPDEELHPIMYLEPFVAFSILANAVAIGFQADPVYRDWQGWMAVEGAFVTFLLIEITVRLWLSGWRACLCGEDRLWNCFEICLTLVAAVDILVFRVGMSETTDVYAAWLIRIFRLIRLVRVLRIFRLRFMKDLRLMVKGLLAGVGTLSLSFVLLFCILYVVAGFATISFGHDPKLMGMGLDLQFRTVPAAMFTAFRCFTGDCNTDAGQPIASLLAAEYGLPFIMGFVSSYLLVALGIFNVILAVYVDITMKAAKETELLTAEQHFRESIRVARTTRELLKRFAAAHRWMEEHKNDTGDSLEMEKSTSVGPFTDDEVHENLAINKECFLMAVQDREVQMLMNQLDLPPDRANLFEIIDADGSGALHIAELVHGLLKVRGEVKKSDTVAALLATKAVQEMLQEMQQEHRADMRYLQNLLNAKHVSRSAQV